MSLEHSSPNAVAAELGDRLRQARLNADLTQIEVAKLAGLTRKVVGNAEKGHVQLDSFVAIMLALDLAGHLDKFLPKQEISPIQLMKLHGRTRSRASGTRTDKAKEKPEW